MYQGKERATRAQSPRANQDAALGSSSSSVTGDVQHKKVKLDDQDWAQGVGRFAQFELLAPAGSFGRFDARTGGNVLHICSGVGRLKRIVFPWKQLFEILGGARCTHHTEKKFCRAFRARDPDVRKRCVSKRA